MLSPVMFKAQKLIIPIRSTDFQRCRAIIPEFRAASHLHDERVLAANAACRY